MYVHVFLLCQRAIDKLHSHLRLFRQLLGRANIASPARIEQSLPIRHLPASLPPPAAATQTRVEHERRDREPNGRPHEREHGPAEAAADVEVRPVLEHGAELGEQRGGDHGGRSREEGCKEGSECGDDRAEVGQT